MKALEKIEHNPSVFHQAAALPWRAGAGIEIMLITSLDTRRWVLPKGGLMSGESLWSAAEREAQEEAGLEGVMGPDALGSYHYEKRIPGGAPQLCSVAVYPMKVTLQRENWPERDMRTTKWFSLEEAGAAVREDELRELILAFNYDD